MLIYFLAGMAFLILIFIVSSALIFMEKLCDLLAKTSEESTWKRYKQAFFYVVLFWQGTYYGAILLCHRIRAKMHFWNWLYFYSEPQDEESVDLARKYVMRLSLKDRIKYSEIRSKRQTKVHAKELVEMDEEMFDSKAFFRLYRDVEGSKESHGS